MKAICQDLAEECQELDDLVSALSPQQWETKTPFFDWTIKDEICHLAYFDSTAYLSTQSREEFTKEFERLLTETTPGASMFEGINQSMGKQSISELLETWRDNRDGMLSSLEKLDPKARLPWYGPDMSARSFATARLMETWAHGQDVYDTLKLKRKNTERLKHIAHIGVTTFGWSFMVRQMEVPAVEVSIKLKSPIGESWNWGPDEAENSVEGDAESFCLVVTQRRNIADINLNVKGDVAAQWMKIAQAFAGMAEDPPAPGARVVVYQ